MYAAVSYSGYDFDLVLGKSFMKTWNNLIRNNRCQQKQCLTCTGTLKEMK